MSHTFSYTPTTSPHATFSVGQAYPPNLVSPTARAIGRPPSPNYFGLVVDGSHESHDSSMPGQHNWSPASSSIKSFTAALPKPVSLEANPDLAAFKRHIERTRGGGPSALPTVGNVPTASSLAPVRPRPTRWHTHHVSDARQATDARSASDASSFRQALEKTRALLREEAQQNGAAHVETPRMPKDLKRNSDSLLLPEPLTVNGPLASPLPLDEMQSAQEATVERDPRFTLMERRAKAGFALNLSAARASTLPMKLNLSGDMLNTEQLRDILETVDSGKILLLDIRSAQNYSHSRIRGALNLCIPTTLLKRATFNIEKLQQTFQGGSSSGKFAEWKSMGWIIVYDANATDSRDAVTAQNMIKKFTSAGYTGKTAILRGGFAMFRDSFPAYIDAQSSASPPGATTGPPKLSMKGLAPVIGGVQMPSALNSSNPFFSNIRQNMDLADGVGQLEAKRPEGLYSPGLPQWLRSTTSPDDHGKMMAEKFLKIEQEEQSRMRGAYAAFNPQHDKSGTKVQLCGVEKGVKNRYKDILPFEHARVRLHDRMDGSCDYINASHLSASGSSKKYIATQGPLPATFDDFWSVIWEQDVRVIVMLTALSEGGQLKCHPYWESKDFGAIRLRLLSEKKASLDLDRQRADSNSSAGVHGATEQKRRRANTTTTFEVPSQQDSNSEATYVVVRKFALSHTAYPFEPMREITHLYFPGWPDFGTPAQPSQLLALVDLANVMQRAAMPVETTTIVESHKATGDLLPGAWFDQPTSEQESRPMLVHCSAGCGRTGSFCTVDTVIDMLKRQRQDDVRDVSPKVVDKEGDVAMNGTLEYIAPMPNGESYFAQSASSLDSVVKLQSQQGASQLDLSWLQSDDVDLIERTVRDFREQRLSMVQSLRQYVLCYESILEWVSRAQDRSARLDINERKRSGSLTFESR